MEQKMNGNNGGCQLSIVKSSSIWKSVWILKIRVWIFVDEFCCTYARLSRIMPSNLNYMSKASVHTDCNSARI